MEAEIRSRVERGGGKDVEDEEMTVMMEMEERGGGTGNEEDL